MREIKFRALFEHMGTGDKLWFFTTVGCAFSATGYVQKTDWLEYTGLLDKNGKEIYEGDIMDGNASITHAVIYIPSHARFMLRSKVWTDKGGIRHKRKVYSSLGRLRNKNIIGNIYENPELVQP